MCSFTSSTTLPWNRCGPLRSVNTATGPAANRESEEQGDQPDLPVRDAVEPRQAALALPAVSTPYKTAVLVTCKTPSPCANVANVARDHGTAVPALDGRRIPPIWQGLRFVRVGPVNLCIMNKLWGTRLDSNEGPLPCQGARGAPALSHGRPESRCWSKRSAAMASTCTHSRGTSRTCCMGWPAPGGATEVASG